jgi:leucyl aminopeptidase
MALIVQLAAAIGDDVDVVVVPVFADLTVPEGSSVAVDVASLVARGFEAKLGQTMVASAGSGTTVLATGLGSSAGVTADTLRRAAAAAVQAARHSRVVGTTLLEATPAGVPASAAAQAVAEGALLGSYQFTTYKTGAKLARLERLDVVGEGAELVSALQRGSAIAGAVAMARDLVNEPPGTVTPIRLAEVATAMADGGSLECTILDADAIKAEGLGGLRGVSLGSDQPPRLIKLTYEPSTGSNGSGGSEPPPTVVLVGKGITFDSGGLSLKTPSGMESMKTDMAGAAAVLATMSLLPALQPPVKVIGIVPATENLPGGSAIKPGDVLKIRNGKTVEVLNTDAEGRLVLADGLSLAVEADADAIVDLATLTGACVVALGREIAGIMTNSEEWQAEVQAAAVRSGEPLWPLPLPDRYRSHIDSQVADIKNMGEAGAAGAIAAGMFLKEFVADVPWVHLDIAGPSWSERDAGFQPRGGTAFGVRTLVELLTGGTIRRRTRPDPAAVAEPASVSTTGPNGNGRGARAKVTAGAKKGSAKTGRVAKASSGVLAAEVSGSAAARVSKPVKGTRSGSGSGGEGAGRRKPKASRSS